MAGIALAGLFLGSMADRRGRRFKVLVGLTLFAAASALIAVNRALAPLRALLFVSALAGRPRAGFALATVMAAALAIALLLNAIRNRRLEAATAHDQIDR
jgi:MFS family permease